MIDSDNNSVYFFWPTTPPINIISPIIVGSMKANAAPAPIHFESFNKYTPAIAAPARAKGQANDSPKPVAVP